MLLLPCTSTTALTAEAQQQHAQDKKLLSHQSNLFNLQLEKLLSSHLHAVLHPVLCAAIQLGQTYELLC